MDDFSPILLAALTGFISGLLLSIPIGPVNLTILNEGARRGFKWALAIGLGATTMEVVYCFIAFTGFAALFTRGPLKAGMEIFTLGFFLYLGIKFLRAKSVEALVHAGPSRIEQRFHPHSGFMIGVVRVMANLGVFVFWIVLAAKFISKDWVQPDWPGKLACVFGVGLGVGFFFLMLSFYSSRGAGKLSERTLLRMEHGSGIALLLLGLAHGVYIVWEIVHHKF